MRPQGAKLQSWGKGGPGSEKWIRSNHQRQKAEHDLVGFKHKTTQNKALTGTDACH
jgi:hypothetical protein